LFSFGEIFVSSKKKREGVRECVTCVAWHAFSAVMMVKNPLALENSLRDAMFNF